MSIETSAPPERGLKILKRIRRRFDRKKVEEAVRGAELLKKLEGVEPTKDNLLKAFEGEELQRILNAMKFKDHPGSQKEKTRGFMHFEKTADSILAMTKEPIAIFGSLALYKRHFRPDREIPDDVDIATTPKGAEELQETLRDRDDVIITDKLGLHDEGGPLASLRLAGYLLHDGQTHPFEIFGEGGTYKGVEYQGLFQLGDKEHHDAKALIDGNVFTHRSLRTAYERIKGIEDKKGGDRKSRTAKIALLKREIRHTQDHLSLVELRRRLESDKQDGVDKVI